MEAKTDRLYPSAPFGNNYLEERLEEKLNEVNSFNNYINNIKNDYILRRQKKTNPKRNIKNTKQ